MPLLNKEHCAGALASCVSVLVGRWDRWWRAPPPKDPEAVFFWPFHAAGTRLQPKPVYLFQY
jgi:hypothetical protein